MLIGNVFPKRKGGRRWHDALLALVPSAPASSVGSFESALTRIGKRGRRRKLESDPAVR
jgi:hypothetical protein